MSDKYDEPASNYEAEMLDNQIAFIKYAADEIRDHVHRGGVFPEWFQNKLSGVHEKIKTLHAYMEGERQQEKERKDMVSMKDQEDDYFESLGLRLKEALTPQEIDQALSPYEAKRKALQDIQADPNTDKDPDLKKELARRVAQLKKEYPNESKDDPCWKGYEMIGMKKKGKKEVPNCVPKKKK